MLEKLKNIVGDFFNSEDTAINPDEDYAVLNFGLGNICRTECMVIKKPDSFFNAQDIWYGTGRDNPGLKDFIEKNCRIPHVGTSNNRKNNYWDAYEEDTYEVEECYLLELPQNILNDDKAWNNGSQTEELLERLKSLCRHDFAAVYRSLPRLGIQGARNLPSRNHIRFSTGLAVYVPYPEEEKKWRVLMELRYLDKESNQYKCHKKDYVDIFDEQKCVIGKEGVGLSLNLYNNWPFRSNDMIILRKNQEDEDKSHSVYVSSDDSDRFGDSPRWSTEDRCYAVYYANNKQKILIIKVVQIKDLHDTAVDPEKEKTDDIFNQLFPKENVIHADYPTSRQPSNDMRKKFDFPANQGTILADTVTNNIQLRALALQRPSHFYTHPIKGFNMAFNTNGDLAALENTDKKLIFCVNRSDRVAILDQMDNVSPLWCEYADLVKNDEIKSKYRLEFCQFNNADQLSNYLGYVLLLSDFNKRLTINKGETLELGRNGNKSKVIRPLSYCEFEWLDGNKGSLDALGLSREHMTARIDDKGLYIRLQNGRQAFHLDEHLNFVASIPSDQEYLLADKQHILVANYIWQYQTKF